MTFNIIKSVASWKIVILLKKTVQEFTTDNCPLLAAAISYYLLLSIFPFLLGIISLSSFFIDAPALQEQIFQAFKYLIPVSQDFILNVINSVIDERGAIGIISIILLLVGCTAFFGSLRKSLNTAWGIHKSSSLIRSQLTNFAMILGAVLLLFISRFITIILNISENILSTVAYQPLTNLVLLHLLVIVIDIALAFLVFLILYKFVPERRIRWRDVWVSALAAAVCFETITIIFMLYLNTFNPYNLIYGSLGAIIALLIWTYLAALIFLFFAKISAVNLRIKTEQLQQNVPQKLR
ncbi:MAG: YihY/virulence factor BrkB family protein [Chloroflexi bacterium]|nr:YihY/virulence factor BrkB family protein [Chloroflexota bacterium]